MIHFLRICYISWSTIKQNFVALSSAEVKYVVDGLCRAQMLWIKQQWLDFGMDVDRVPILFDYDRAINIENNIVQHK